ncbi:aminotransferase [Verticillium dahliae VdLs.17]|uniref:Aminotransferase n=1 Tax=Verticillium dahliae (strain VdLs.17 / ATCC MYA-4575 / FGSC 10137) TaxID=498257 RepID=G2XJ06_VERDV|nr:aminotransferase [Verticillium dahliae VdLs.17]EGY20509.1 aminotransferase [Verticillium dahliae VdLs.17]
MVTRTPHLINLLRGWPSPSLLPAAALTAAAARALSDPTISVPGLQYAPDPGFQPLREHLAAWLARFYGAAPEADGICITGGASQSLANMLASFTDPGFTRAIWMVAPCYFLACPIFEDAGFGGRLRAVPEDDDGANVEVLAQKLQELDEAWERDGRGAKDLKKGAHRKLYRHVIYLVPTCANPSGKTLPLRRREALVRLARAHDMDTAPAGAAAWHRLCARAVPAARSAPAPAAPAPFGHAVSNGSFSKIVAPGVRTGWVAATPAFAYGLSQTGASCSGGAPSQLAAVMVWELLRSGELERRLVEESIPQLRERHRRVLEAVEALLVPLGVAGVRGADVADRGRELGVTVGAGERFEVAGDEDGARFEREVRICFSWEEVEDVVEGVRRLSHAVRDVQQGKFVAGRRVDATYIEK